MFCWYTTIFFIQILQLLKFLAVECWDSNSIGTKGHVKEGLELTLMGSFNVGQGGHVKYWDSNSMRDEGGRQGGLELMLRL